MPSSALTLEKVSSGPMGEVRTTVRLTNLVDAALAEGGQLPQSAVHTCVEDAIVDTGAVRTAVPRWEDDGWFVGQLKDIPGVVSQAETLEDLEENIRDAYWMMEDEELLSE